MLESKAGITGNCVKFLLKKWTTMDANIHCCAIVMKLLKSPMTGTSSNNTGQLDRPSERRNQQAQHHQSWPALQKPARPLRLSMNQHADLGLIFIFNKKRARVGPVSKTKFQKHQHSLAEQPAESCVGLPSDACFWLTDIWIFGSPALFRIADPFPPYD